ncbi:MAG: hypothetical protein M1817_002097 [Caeruleum heppii]|nr:MAG: hypothetical protein M1817_002097 [Caeruleum heppii]
MPTNVCGVWPLIFSDPTSIILHDPNRVHGGFARLVVSDDGLGLLESKLREWRFILDQFSLADDEVKVLVTEHLSNAINFESVMHRIRSHGKWAIQCLTAQDEARLGVWGVMGSFRPVRGLVARLTAGSLQLAWVNETGRLRSRASLRSMSISYDSALLAAHIDRSGISAHPSRDPEESPLNLVTALRRFCRAMPRSLVEHYRRSRRLTLFLAGKKFGSLRSDGSKYLKFSKIDASMPSQIRETSSVGATAASALPMTRQDLSLNYELTGCAPGSLIDGLYYSALSRSDRSRHAFVDATIESKASHCDYILDLVWDAFGPPLWRPPVLDPGHITAAVNLMYWHNHLTDQERSAAVLQLTTSGVQCNMTYGLSHDDRLIVALLLHYRWDWVQACAADGSLCMRLHKLVRRDVIWWCRMMGGFLYLLGCVYPDGLVDVDHPLVQFRMSQRAVHGPLAPGETRPHPRLSLDIYTAFKRVSREGKQLRECARLIRKPTLFFGRDLSMDVFVGYDRSSRDLMRRLANVGPPEDPADLVEMARLRPIRRVRTPPGFPSRQPRTWTLSPETDDERPRIVEDGPEGIVEVEPQ